jgi:hypothetical protein
MVKVLSVKDSVGRQIDRVKLEMQEEDKAGVSFSKMITRVMKKAGYWKKEKKVED